MRRARCSSCGRISVRVHPRPRRRYCHDSVASAPTLKLEAQGLFRQAKGVLDAVVGGWAVCGPPSSSSLLLAVGI